MRDLPVSCGAEVMRVLACAQCDTHWGMYEFSLKNNCLCMIFFAYMRNVLDDLYMHFILSCQTKGRRGMLLYKARAWR